MISHCNLIRFINSKRHAAGYGVHSQFAFELILDTIHNPYSYYIYNDNKIKTAKTGLIMKQTDVKHAELLFRLTNRFNAKNTLEIGSGFGINTLYICAHSNHSKVTCVELEDDKINKAKDLLADTIENIIFSGVLPTEERCFNAIIWNLKQYPDNEGKVIETINRTIKDGGFVVVNQKNKRKGSNETWQKILQLNKLTMSFDLGTIGIGFFNPSLPKLNYDVYF